MNRNLSHGPIYSSDVCSRLTKLKSFYLLAGIILTVLITIFATSVYVSATNENLSLSALVRDPLAYAGLPPYIGLISNLGVLLWCSTTTLCLFGSFLLKESSQKVNSSFLLYGGLLNLLFTFDDLFLLHEENSVWFKGLFYIPEKFIFLTYGIVLVFFLTKFRRAILKTKEWRLLAVSLMLFSASIFVDLLNIPNLSGEVISFLEDGCKLFGIFFWFSYYLSVCWEIPHWILQKPAES